MKSAIEVGAAGRNVAENVKRLRAARGMSLRNLSEALAATGRPLSADALNKVENAARSDAKQIRRVDVDDLCALATVLDVEPSQLLLSPQELIIEVRVGSAGDCR